MSLKQKTISGLLWSFADNFARLGITFVVGIILARLLTPREFGLIGMTTIFIAVSQSFVDSGFRQALIRKQDCSQADFSTVFYFNLLVSLVMYVLLVGLSGLIGRFFSEPLLESVIRILGLGLIINGLCIVQQAQLTKAINFRLQTIVTIVSSVISGGIGISMALAGYGVWSLVTSTLSNSFITMLLLWLFNGWRPSLVFSLTSFTGMFSFGSKLLMSGLIDTVFRNSYFLIIGRYFSASDLGYYSRADGFARLPSENITNVVQRVSYPVLSGLQSDLPRLRSAYQKLIKSTMLLTFFLMMGVVVVAEPMVLLLIGEKWRPSIAYLQLLSFVTMLYPLHAINLNMLQVQGRSDLFLRLELFKKLLILPIIVTGVIFGIKIMIIGMITHSLVAYYLNSYWSGNLIGYSVKQQVIDWLPSFVLASAVWLVVYLASFQVAMPPLYLLVVQLALGVLLGVGCAELLRLESYLYIKLIVLEKLFRKTSATTITIRQED